MGDSLSHSHTARYPRRYGFAEKPVVVDGKIEIREMLSVTVSFDHDIVDGAPAARFTSQLKSLIESGYGLVEQEVATEQVR